MVRAWPASLAIVALAFALEGAAKPIANVQYHGGVNPPAFVQNLHFYIYSAAEPGVSEDTDEEWFEIKGGTHDCSGSTLDSGPAGAVCPLDQFTPTEDIAKQEYDEGGDDPDYQATVAFCLSHEKYETHTDCVAAHDEGEEIRPCSPVASACP